MTSRSRLLVSIILIIAYWIFAVFSSQSDNIEPPGNLTAIVTSILFAKIVTLVILFLLLTFEGDSMHNLGFHSPGLSAQLLRGILFGIVIWLIIHIGLNPLIKYLLPENELQRVNMAMYFREFSNVLVWIPLVIFGGGFVEEFQRIFILTRFEKWLKTPGLILSLVVSTIVFGMGHLYQGPNSAISAGASGLLFAMVYLRKRMAWEAVSAHAFYDVIGVVVGWMVAR